MTEKQPFSKVHKEHKSSFQQRRAAETKNLLSTSSSVDLTPLILLPKSFDQHKIVKDITLSLWLHIEEINTDGKIPKEVVERNILHKNPGSETGQITLKQSLMQCTCPAFGLID